MKLIRNRRNCFSILALATSFTLLLGLSSCHTGIAPSSVTDEEDTTATLSITIPNMAPWVQKEADSGDFKPKAWLINDAVEFQLYDMEMNLVTYFIEEPGVDTYYDWAVPPGEYYLYTWIYNYNSTDWIDYGEASVFGAYPSQPDLWNPTNSFTVAAGQSLSVTVTNYPTAPVEILNSTASAEFLEATEGEKWFTVTTGSSDTWMYIDAGSYSADGVIDADMDLYLFGPGGLFITSSEEWSDGDPSTSDLEAIDSEVAGTAFTVIPGATYYVAVYAYEGGYFDLYFQSSP